MVKNQNPYHHAVAVSSQLPGQMLHVTNTHRAPPLTSASASMSCPWPAPRPVRGNSPARVPVRGASIGRNKLGNYHVQLKRYAMKGSINKHE